MAFLSAFSKAQRAAYPSIRLGVARGLSANSILRTLTTSGLGINRNVGLKLIKAVKQSAINPSNYLSGNPTDKPIAELIPPSLTDQTKRYRYTVSGAVFDPSIEQWYEKNVSIESNVLWSQGEILEAGRNLMTDTSGDFGAEVGDVWIAQIDDSFTPVII